MSDCLFCKIAKKEIPSKVVHEDDKVLAFEDLNPQAPVHVLIIPKKHIPTLNDVSAADRDHVFAMIEAAKKIAADKGLSENGYRTVFNVNRDAGQTVFHLHLHLLGGRKFIWPPG
ncbi:MAG: histidine triad nucleotide-binding protein [Spirochaetia bacterium]|nr:histidine triad nucleotide-binding protein [Spirochaetia bacterium]